MNNNDHVTDYDIKWISNVIFYKPLDNNEFEVTEINGDTSIHYGDVSSIQVREFDKAFTVFYK